MPMTWMKWTSTLCIALLGSFPGFSCTACPSPRDREHVEKSATGKGEIPFELLNDHLIIVKGTIGPLENVNIMLDTGKSPTAISKKIAEQVNLRGNQESLLLSNGKIEVQSVILP